MESYPVYLIARSALSAARLLPRSAAIHVLDVLASITYRLDRIHRHIASVNLAIAFPELSIRERHEIGRRSFQNTGRNLLEVGTIPTLNSANVAELVEYDPDFGLNNLKKAHARGSGILYLTGHFSAWELLPAAHAYYGYPLSFVTRPLDNASLERYLRRIRESAGNEVIYKRNSARKILEKLKAAGAVGILMDQNTSLQEGTFVDFFGLPAATTTSVALLALRTDAAVLPGYLKPIAGGRYAIKFLPPVDLIRSNDTGRDVTLNTQKFNDILEGIIREQPDTWLWGHRRWSYQPPGTPDLYRLPPDELRAFLRTKQVRTEDH